MKRLAVIFFSAFFVVAVSHSSMAMFSIEQGKVYTEAYDPSHIFTSISPGPCNFSKHKGSLSSKANLSHLHILFLNSVNTNEDDSIVFILDQSQTELAHTTLQELLSEVSPKNLFGTPIFKFLPQQRESFLKSTILLI
jgi:hypothetical protein